MGLVAAKCTQCGSSIEVDNSQDAGICSHCGMAFITEKVINNYSTFVTQHITKNIYGKEQSEADDYIRNGEVYINLKDWGKAKKNFLHATELNPSNYKAWLGLVQSETKNFTDLNNNSHEEYFEKALIVSNIKEKEIINNICGNYIRLSKEHNNNKKAEYLKKNNLKNNLHIMEIRTYKKYQKLNLIGSIVFCIGCLMLSFGLLGIVITLTNAIWWALFIFGVISIVVNFFIFRKTRNAKNEYLAHNKHVLKLVEEINIMNEDFVISGDKIPNIE